MSLTYLGSLTVGVINPGLLLALASALPRIQAALDGAAAAIASLNVTPPTIAASLSLAQTLAADIQAAIALGVEVPSLSVQVNALLALQAALNIELGALGFDLGAAGIHAYAYDGLANGLGPALPASFPGGSELDHVNALVLATSVPASWVALAAVLKTT